MALIKKFRIKSFKKQKPLVSLKKISLSFGKRQILDDINFDVNPGQVFVETNQEEGEFDEDEDMGDDMM